MLDRRVHDAARACFDLDSLHRRDLRPTRCVEVCAVGPNTRAYLWPRSGLNWARTNSILPD